LRNKMARKQQSKLTHPHITLTVLGIVVFISGFCSLAYQVVWLREFRLIFGGAAPAASAVLAVFMGGLGLGGLHLGKRVEQARYPGRLYAWIEGGITVATLLSPLLFLVIRKLYILSGGVQTLGLPVATLLQVLMTAVVIGPACYLMGGTLPGVLRVAQKDEDGRRATTALFYGLNVAGAVTGAAVATFWWLQVMGNFWTLFVACVVNAAIAALAYVMLRNEVREMAEPASYDVTEKRTGNKTDAPPAAPVWFFPAVAFLSGFAFFVIELVWYRASIPLFGGSVYNFGLILAVALAGIGGGSLIYSWMLPRVVPSYGLFAMVSGLLALCIIAPFVMGDRLAHAALLLNNFFMPRSFEGLVFGWTCVCVVLVFLPAFFSGIQFPLLISLIGRGGRDIGMQLGRVYAWNTLGAVSGALIGGFLLLPWLGITGSWRAAALMAMMISILALFQKRKSQQLQQPRMAGKRAARISLIACVLTILACWQANGPSAYWLHHPIGYGRANALYGASEVDWIRYVNAVNRSLITAKDGHETSGAVVNTKDYSMLSNGKSDSSAIGDSSTTVMSGLIGAILHPREVKNACVVGFGTGITAGWMAQVKSIERIDVIELERVIVELGEYFKRANFDVSRSPKVRLLEGDAREILVTKPESYDLIVSEPSNLHRAGVANLYTQEFYESVSSRLESDGLFCQWVQTYETDLASVQLVIATLSAVFPKVELWQPGSGDLLLVCSKEKQPWQLAKVRHRLQQEPFARGMRLVWGTSNVEGFFARAVANADYASYFAHGTQARNTDDLNHLEFWFAHNLGKQAAPVMGSLIEAANERGSLLPEFAADGSEFDYDLWAKEFLWRCEFFESPPMLPKNPKNSKGWSDAIYKELDFVGKLHKISKEKQAQTWPIPASSEISHLLRLSALANVADPRFENEIPSIRETWPLEYFILRAEYEVCRNRPSEALKLYYQAVKLSKSQTLIRDGYYDVLWAGVERMIKIMTFESKEELIDWFQAASSPAAFAGITDIQRRVMMSLSMPLDLKYQVRAAEAWGEYPEWNEQVLRFQRDVYQKAKHPAAKNAAKRYEMWQRSTAK